MEMTEVIAKYGEKIKAFEFTTEKVYLLLGDKTKITDRELLWVGRALDKAGVWVIIGMIDPDALRIVQLEKDDEEKLGVKAGGLIHTV
jgi:hypothetical protein